MRRAATASAMVMMSSRPKATTAARMLALVTLAAVSAPLLGQDAERARPAGNAYTRADNTVSRLYQSPPMLTADRVPVGMELGRCLLEVDGQALVAGPCTYIVHTGGSFSFNGPRQVYAGIDYSEKAMPMGMSTDHFVYVTHYASHEISETGLEWVAHYNNDKHASHAQDYLGELSQDGACFTNARAKICLWKS